MFVYLDQMHWVSLAKAALGRADGRAFVPILAWARRVIRTGHAVFPLSSAHLMETANTPKPKQRILLAQLMTELSMGCVLRWPGPIIHFQIRNAVRQMFGEPPITPEPPPFARGVDAAFPMDLAGSLNLPQQTAALVRRSLDTPEGWIMLLSHLDEPSRIAGLDAVRASRVQQIENAESVRVRLVNTDLDLTQREYCVRLTHVFERQLLDSLHEIGRTFKEWISLGRQRLTDFWRSIPTLHVELELHTQMHRQVSKPWSGNDTLDIGFLSSAIPSCDIVVTERFWVDLAKRRCLDTHYKTMLLSKLEDLDPFLDN